MMVDLPGFAGAPVVEPAVTGSTEELAGILRQLAGDGITHVQLWVEPNTVAGIEAFTPMLDQLDRG